MTADDSYLTVESSSEGIFKAKGSKHFGYVFPMSRPEELKVHLEQLRSDHPQAGHFAFAYRLGNQGQTWRVHDDGEPKNTAGPPILGALRSRNITYCLGVVVRYFGGTKLGVGGLIEAYREATNEALTAGSIIQVYSTCKFSLAFPYAQIGPVMSLLKRQGHTPIDPIFQMTCTLTVELRLHAIPAFLKASSLLSEVAVSSIDDSTGKL